MIDRISAALSRRRVLVGLGAACAAATVAPDAGVASAIENPELIALGDALPSAVKTYIEADTKVAQIVKEWSPQWPEPAPEIIDYRDGSKTYRGIDGIGIELPWGKGGMARVPELGTPESFKSAAEHHQIRANRKAATKSQRGLKFHEVWVKRSNDAIAPARAYWMEAERITAASGIDSAQKAKKEARDALRAIVGAIMATEETTIAGVIIKAQALTAWGHVEILYQALNMQGQEWAESLAGAIMRQSGAA